MQTSVRDIFLDLQLLCLWKKMTDKKSWYNKCDKDWNVILPESGLLTYKPDCYICSAHFSHLLQGK